VSDTKNDKTFSELLHVLEPLQQANPELVWWLKWTCPACGERVTADQANTHSLSGYRHTEKEDGSPCGVNYNGILFGVRIVVSLAGKND